MATDNKYDRQMRLWGANGQKALAESRICLVNAGPTGTEILKNLVLPGCGYIYIIDSEIVSERDCDNNFFVTRADLGKSRGEVTTQLLLELNPDVSGGYTTRAIEDILKDEPNFFSQFTTVIITQSPFTQLEVLATVLEASNVPFIVAQSTGLLGIVRVWSGEHCIIESKPMAYKHDLRIQHPFESLRRYAEAFDLDRMDKMSHKHVPFVVLLLVALDAWKAGHGDCLPSTFAEKQEFKRSVAALARFEEEDNVEEAEKHADLAFTSPLYPQELSELLEDAACSHLAPTSSPFWFVARAIRDFLHKHSVLPLSGELPDMTATTDAYVQLQHVFREQAARETQEVKATLRALLAAHGKAEDSIADEYVELMCKNAAHLAVVRTHSVLAEINFDDVTKEGIVEGFSEVYDETSAEQAAVTHYISYRAAEEFQRTHGRYPGCDDSGVKLQADAEEVFAIAQRLLAKCEISDSYYTMAHASEIVRYGHSEIHAIAAILGGIGSQEAIKIITKQFVPVDNTFIFNGINGAGATLKV